MIDVAVRLVNLRPDTGRRGELDLGLIPIDDPETFELLQSGDTKGVFQLESSGMQQLFRDLQPDAFEDVVAAVALYRPGPIGSGMVKDFVDCKRGRKAIEGMHPLVDDILVPTYGVIVYQEQVMQIAQKLAGYTLGGADLLRRAMGKKKPEEMAKQKTSFISGAEGMGVKKEDAERIFALLEYFAGYGFNKSHSAAYALITYQTAYLKAHYPVEFLCALMTADRNKIEEVVRIIADGRALGVEVLPPEINESRVDFTVVYDPVGSGDVSVREAGPRQRGLAAHEARGPLPPGARHQRRARRRVDDPMGPKIRFGLGAIRGVGAAALAAILEARDGGPFDDLFDLARRVDVKRVNKSVLEALVQSGAFDTSLGRRGVTRARAFAAVELAIDRSKQAAKDKDQLGLFGRPATSPSTEKPMTLSERPYTEELLHGNDLGHERRDDG